MDLQGSPEMKFARSRLGNLLQGIRENAAAGMDLEGFAFPSFPFSSAPSPFQRRGRLRGSGRGLPPGRVRVPAQEDAGSQAHAQGQAWAFSLADVCQG